MCQPRLLRFAADDIDRAGDADRAGRGSTRFDDLDALDMHQVERERVALGRHAVHQHLRVAGQAQQTDAPILADAD